MVVDQNFKLLVNGCSFSRGPISWPYHLDTVKQTQITNLSLSSAGNTYIHESTVAELSQRKYQGVIIMWSGPCRIDAQVSHPEYFNGSTYTSAYQCQTNDWAEKIVLPVNDSDYIDRSWIFGLGHTNRDQIVYSSKLFEGPYKYLGDKQFVFHLLVKIISLQGILKNLGIPYIFTLYQPYQNLFEMHKELCDLVDWSNFFLDENIYNIAKSYNDLDNDGHPGLISNQYWATVLDRQIRKKILQLENL